MHLLQNATTLQRDIARTLLYFDIFRHPLRISEIHEFLPSPSFTLDDIQNACSTEPLSNYLVQRDGLVGLSNEVAVHIRERREKENRARHMWSVAIFMSRIIRRFPFVRAVFVSGELSKGVASKNSDIDFFVITASNRVWITRTLFTLFKKIVLLNNRKLFCYNHIASVANLEIGEKNIYTAIEVATVRPLYNPALYEEFMRANAWIKLFLPNANPLRADHVPEERQSLVEKIVTSFVSTDRLDVIDRHLRVMWQTIWVHRYRSLSIQKREELFRCGNQVSTAYVNDFLTKITSAYQRRLDHFGLTVVGGKNLY